MTRDAPIPALLDQALADASLALARASALIPTACTAWAPPCICTGGGPDPECLVDGSATVEPDTWALADTIVRLNDLRERAADLLAYVTREAGLVGMREPVETGLGVVQVHRRKDRKEWQHSRWQDDVRAAVVGQTTDGYALLDTATGETRDLAEYLHERLAEAQAVHGAGAPKVTALKALDLDPEDYCTTVRGVFTAEITKPTPATQES